MKILKYIISDQKLYLSSISGVSYGSENMFRSLNINIYNIFGWFEHNLHVLYQKNYQKSYGYLIENKVFYNIKIFFFSVQ